MTYPTRSCAHDHRTNYDRGRCLFPGALVTGSGRYAVVGETVVLARTPAQAERAAAELGVGTVIYLMLTHVGNLSWAPDPERTVPPPITTR